MPIESHPSFNQPSDDTVLWRYMDLARFASLITTRQLWFPTAEVLAADDPHEARWPLANYRHRDWGGRADVPADVIESIDASSYGPHADFDYKLAQVKFLRDQSIKHMEIYRRSMCVNCWHAVPYESAAMWKIYAGGGGGVAIQSSAGAIANALGKTEGQIYMGSVVYIRDSDPPVNFENVFNAATLKRSAFEYEREVRLVHSLGLWGDMPQMHLGSDGYWVLPPADVYSSYLTRPQPSGKAFEVDLGELMHGVWLSPYSPPWHEKLVTDLCEAFGLSTPIKRSALLDPPAT